MVSVKVKEGEKVRVVSVKAKEGEKVGVVSVKVKEGEKVGVVSRLKRGEGQSSKCQG